MATKIQKGTVCFRIYGEFITNHARDRVLEGEWEDAIRFLKASFHEIDYDTIINVLAGTHEFIGDSSTEVTLRERTNVKYMQKLDATYGFYLKIGRFYYVPYSYITSYGLPDFLYYDDAHSTRNLKDKMGRARFYCRDKLNDKIFSLTHKGLEYCVLFERAHPRPPLWMDIDKTPQQAFDASFVKEDGFVSRYGDDYEYPDSYILKISKERNIDPNDEDIKFRENPRTTKNCESPPVDYELLSQYGWIDPTGVFYGCTYAKHIDTADRIVRIVLGHKDFETDEHVFDNNAENMLEKLGYLKIGGLGKSPYFLHKTTPTQAQQNTLFEWCQKHKSHFPDHLFDKCDE